MQINFTPHKIKAAKAYIENLCEDEKKIKKIENKRENKLSFFQKLKRLFF
ncbi:hypothetical protein MNB_SV-12-793 [hydrothermal vent metagenome]|uniref:Uncharacterized protein n=1 Tax=hydrothermal vent metagenome TaxID=652676 RepID=A0A1W1BWW8_9ZZZZ